MAPDPLIKLAVAATLCMGSARGQDAAARSASARLAGQYSEALAQAAQVGDPARRALLELEARYWAGDLGGALRAARGGLEQAPEHTELLYYATLLPLDMAIPELAADVLPRLEQAIAASADMTDDVRSSYLERCEEFAGRLAEQQASSIARGAAYSLARTIVIAVGGGLVLLTLGLVSLVRGSSEGH